MHHSTAAAAAAACHALMYLISAHTAAAAAERRFLWFSTVFHDWDVGMGDFLKDQMNVRPQTNQRHSHEYACLGDM